MWPAKAEGELELKRKDWRDSYARSKNLIVKGGTGLGCWEDRGGERQSTPSYAGPLENTQQHVTLLAVGHLTFGTATPMAFPPLTFVVPYDYQEYQGKHLLAGLSFVFSPPCVPTYLLINVHNACHANESPNTIAIRTLMSPLWCPSFPNISCFLIFPPF